MSDMSLSYYNVYFFYSNALFVSICFFDGYM